MIFDSIYAFFSIDMPKQGTPEYRDLVCNAFFLSIGVILFLAFVPDLFKKFKNN